MKRPHSFIHAGNSESLIVYCKHCGIVAHREAYPIAISDDVTKRRIIERGCVLSPEEGTK